MIYEKYLADEGKRLSLTTVNNLKTAWRDFTAFFHADVTMQEVDRLSVSRFGDEYLPAQTTPRSPNGPSPATVIKKLSQLWRWAMKRGYLPARSLGDLQDIVRALKAKGVALKATEQPIDTSSAAGKAFLDMLGVFAEFETNLRRERQLEGIAAAKARGVYKGRRPTIDPEEIRRLTRQGMGATAIAKTLKIGRASVYRMLRGEAA